MYAEQLTCLPLEKRGERAVERKRREATIYLFFIFFF